MKESIHIVKIPRVNVNDSIATLVEWHVSEGDAVDKGDIICSIETSKAIFDIEADFKGHIVQLVDKDQELSFSDSVALIGENFEALKKEKSKYASPEHGDSRDESSKGSVKATRKAEALAEKLGVDLSCIKADGIVKEKDVVAYKEKLQSGNEKYFDYNETEIESSSDLIGNRKIGKELLLESANNIPQSYIERTMVTNDHIKTIEDYKKKKGQMISFLSVVISALGRTLEMNKIFNSYRDGNQILTYKNINIGVIVNHDNNISIPTIMNTPSFHPAEIAQELMRIRMSIMRKKPNIKDLTGATFTVSALDHTEVTRFIPIVHPKQAAILAIPKIQLQTENADREHATRGSFLNLGLSFDHSFLDAMQASNFLDNFIKSFNDTVASLR